MRRILQYRRLGAALAVLILAGVVHAESDPLDDPNVQKTLRAMANASTWYHPDLFGEFAGMRYYSHHQFNDALKYFEIGAFYADKLSQLSIGLMHLNGEGTQKDPISAYAWLDLAAERNYPDFVATRDHLKTTLTPEQLAQAMELRKTLAERYGDHVAKWRMTVQLRLGQMQLSGYSRIGSDSGVSQLNTATSCGPTIVVGGSEVPQAGCGGSSVNAKERWDPNLYFAARDRQWKSTVTVGAIEPQNAAGAAETPIAAPSGKPDTGDPQH
jgi:hypothetical protein